MAGKRKRQKQRKRDSEADKKNGKKMLHICPVETSTCLLVSFTESRGVLQKKSYLINLDQLTQHCVTHLTRGV